MISLPESRRKSPLTRHPHLFSGSKSVPAFLIPPFDPVRACPTHRLRRPATSAVGPSAPLPLSYFQRTPPKNRPFCGRRSVGTSLNAQPSTLVWWSSSSLVTHHLSLFSPPRTPPDRKRTPPRATARKRGSARAIARKREEAMRSEACNPLPPASLTSPNLVTNSRIPLRRPRFGPIFLFLVIFLFLRPG